MPKKSDDDFFDETINYTFSLAAQIRKINPECTDEYHDHSVLKLLGIAYWVGIFTPICDKQLRKKYGYKLVYVDTMAGSGVTSSKRGGDYFAGSCPIAVKTAQDNNYPFDEVIAVEIEQSKAETLSERLKLITDIKTTVYTADILEISSKIAVSLQNFAVAYIVIDPHGLRGMTWQAISPLLALKGDAIVIWFENEAWRLKQAAISDKQHKAIQSDINRMDELFGGGWEKTKSADELTELFINRVLNECGKTAHGVVTIPRKKGYYKMILFAGKFQNAAKLTKSWEENITRRLQSAIGKDISSLLEVKSGRQKTLF